MIRSAGFPVGPRFGARTFGPGVIGLVWRGHARPRAFPKTGVCSHSLKTFFWFILAICALVITGCGFVH